MIETRYEGKRGCGERKVGGLYLISGGEATPCGKFPIPFMLCPCCGEGQTFSRSPKMLEQPWRLWESLACVGDCAACPLHQNTLQEPALLIWIGSRYYPTPEDFLREAKSMGISRRIKSVPRDFELGQTWVLLAHIKAIRIPPAVFGDEPIIEPGIFSMFRPESIEVVVDENTPNETIEGYIKRGLTPVKVRPEQEQQALL